jgi:uncharacterized protein
MKPALRRLAERAARVQAASGDVPSPCSSVCQMHETAGWCKGCLRTLDEIATWGALPDAGKREVWQRIRLRALGEQEAA